MKHGLEETARQAYFKMSVGMYDRYIWTVKNECATYRLDDVGVGVPGVCAARTAGKEKGAYQCTMEKKMNTKRKKIKPAHTPFRQHIVFP
jgi:hypothetical protein